MNNPNLKARKVLQTLKEGTKSVRANPSEENYRAWEGRISNAGSSISWGWILGIGLLLVLAGSVIFSVVSSTARVTTNYQEPIYSNSNSSNSNVSTSSSYSSDNSSSSANGSSQSSSGSPDTSPVVEQTNNPTAQISCADKLYYVNLRRTPGYMNKNDSEDSLYEVPCGEYVELLGDTDYVDGLTWWKVSWKGYTGWMADHTGTGKTILIFDQ